MLSYIKNNSRIITKLLLNQFGSAVLGLSLSVVASRQSLFVLMSLFSTAFYLFLLYSAMWEEGGKERIRVDGGRADMKPLRGLWVALIANIPNMVLAVLIIIGKIFGSLDGPFAWEWAGSTGALAGTVARLFEAMYLGLIQTYSPNNPIAFVLIILPGVAVSAGAYALGIYNRRLFGFLSVKKSK